MPDEKELVKKILAGDPGAQNAFYVENAKRLYPISVHFLGYGDSDAEDVVQETFLIAFKKLGKFEFRSSLYTWLSHICANLCYERLRKRKRTLVALESDLEKLTRIGAGAWADKNRATEEKQARLEILGRLTQSMGEKCREILVMRDQQGNPYVQIARALKIPMGTVMSQLARCRKVLKRLLEDELKGAGS